jgi:hypothetical protein
MDAEFLRELRTLRESCSEFEDEYSLFSLLPLMKKLSPEAKMIILIETQKNITQNLFPVTPCTLPPTYTSDSRDESYNDICFPDFH